MNTNFQTVKAKIVAPHIMLVHKVKPGTKDLYETDMRSLCKLIDALTRGKVLDHIYWKAFPTTGFQISGSQTLKRFARYLRANMTPDELRNFFGNISFDTDDGLYAYMIDMSILNLQTMWSDIEKFVLEKYDYKEDIKGFIRKDPNYKNY